jgi:NTE family protein
MPPARSKTALVLAGGGIMGAAYEIGALTALDRLFAPGFSSRRFDLHIGISAGSVIAALLANRVPAAALFRTIANDERSVFNWRRSDIYRLDTREILASCWDVLRNLARIYQSYRRQPWPFSPGDLPHLLLEQFPAGIFSLEPLHKYLCRSFAQEGIIDDFNLLRPELFIPAFDLDLGARVVFGSEGHRDLHICQAITASCAIPYFFRPFRIGERHYIDGSTGDVAHLDIAVERGATLIVLVNPRVPMINDQERTCLPSLSYGRCSSIADLGITFAWEQAQRIENKAKLNLTVENFRRSHPQIDILVIEPSGEESLLFFQSPMSNIARHHIMTHGYHLTLGQLRTNFLQIEAVFARHGIRTSRQQLQAAPPGTAFA